VERWYTFRSRWEPSVPIFNLAETKKPLRLTGPLADIFMERVHQWNDPAITALNPNVLLRRFIVSTRAERRMCGRSAVQAIELLATYMLPKISLLDIKGSQAMDI
jgi:hypothetical protein